MAVPIIPIIMAVAALGSGIAQGISSSKNIKNETKTIEQNAAEQIQERSKQAKKLMQQQKTSFLKGGVYFDSGTPLAMINETFDTMKADVNALVKDSDTKIKNLYRQGKTAFFNSALQGVSNAALSFFSSGGSLDGLKSSSSKIGKSNWFNSKNNLTKGGFGSVSGKNFSSIETV